MSVRPWSCQHGRHPTAARGSCKGDIRTKGGEGPSLVRGRVVTLKAHALSLKPGAQGNAMIVLGQVVTEHADIAPFELVAPSKSVELIMVNGAVVH